jgi:hypothetical protein
MVFAVCAFSVRIIVIFIIYTSLPELASELYQLNGRRLLAKLLPTFAGRGCHMVSITVPYGRILGF